MVLEVSEENDVQGFPAHAQSRRPCHEDASVGVTASPSAVSRLGIRLVALLTTFTGYAEFLPNFRKVLFDVL